MNASKDLSDVIVELQWRALGKEPGNKKATKRLADEMKRRRDLKYADKPQAVAINPDGTLAYAVSAAELDRAARRAHRTPTEAQKRAGNYRCGHVTLQGLDITIETARGSRRRPEWKPLAHHYGYLKRTRSEADGDAVDVFLGPRPGSEVVFIVDQVRPSGRFDEHKVMIGFTSAAEAKEAYLANYDDGWTGFGGMKALTIGAFKEWLRSGDTGQRAGPQRITYAADAHGHEHKGAGPGGGQFTGPGQGGAGSGASSGASAGDGAAPAPAKPKRPAHGERAGALHAKHAALKKALAAFQDERHATFHAVRAEAEAADAKGHAHYEGLHQALQHLAWHSDDETHAPFNELDEAVSAYDETGTPGERFAALKEIEAAARAAQAVELPAAGPDHAQREQWLDEINRATLELRDDKRATSRDAVVALARERNEQLEAAGNPHRVRVDRKGSILGETSDAHLPNGFTPDALADNQRLLVAVVTGARAARVQLKAYVKHRQEMRAIKSGEPMGGSGVEVDPDGTLPGHPPG